MYLDIGGQHGAGSRRSVVHDGVETPAFVVDELGDIVCEGICEGTRACAISTVSSSNIVLISMLIESFTRQCMFAVGESVPSIQIEACPKLEVLHTV